MIKLPKEYNKTLRLHHACFKYEGSSYWIVIPQIKDQYSLFQSGGACILNFLPVCAQHQQRSRKKTASLTIKHKLSCRWSQLEKKIHNRKYYTLLLHFSSDPSIDLESGSLRSKSCAFFFADAITCFSFNPLSLVSV